MGYEQLKNDLRFPNEELIHSIGHLIGDGGISDTQIYYYNSNFLLLKHTVNLFIKTFYLEETFSPPPNNFWIRYNPKLTSLIMEYFPCCKANSKYVPIFGNESFNWSLLRALMEDDCHFYKYKIALGGIWQFTTSKELFARTLWNLCLHLDLKPTELKKYGPYKERFYGYKESERFYNYSFYFGKFVSNTYTCPNCGQKFTKHETLGAHIRHEKRKC